MSRVTYGRTWWGAQWLQSLSSIDHDNRLPRGRTYANRGAVRDMVVSDNHVHARVQGSRPRPYDVDIEVPPLSTADAQRLIQRLATDPGLIARLLNRELDPVVLKESQALGLPVFPARWSDLKMQCSCPDWAVPCKHLAATIYLLSQEIDGDPFLVFRLRKVDLVTLLGADGLSVEAEQAQALPTQLLQLFDTPSTAAPQGPQTSGAIDFSTLPDLREALWLLLPAQPPFWRTGDFREVAHKTVGRVAREAARALERSPIADRVMPLPEGRLQWLLDERGELEPVGIELADRSFQSLSDAIDFVAQLPAERLADLPEPFAHLHTLCLMALHLLAQGAVAPQVYAPAAKQLHLRWCAAELDPTVRDMVARLDTLLEPGWVLQRKGRKREPLPSGTQARVLLSGVIDTQLRRFCGTPMAADKSSGDRVDSQVHALFFGSGHAVLDGPGEGAIAGSIHTWLSRLHLGALTHRPVLHIDEAAEDGFELSLAVVDERAGLDPPTALATVLKSPKWASHRLGVLKTVALLAGLHPPLNDYVRHGARQPLKLSATDLPPLLFETLPAWRLMGVRAVLPRALQRLWRPRLSVQIKASGSSMASSLNTDQLLSFDWKVSIGDELVTPTEFERLLGKTGGIVRFRGQYVMLDAAELEALRAQLARPPKLSGADLLRTALAGEYDGAPIALNKAAEKLIAQLRHDSDVPLPTGLRATLRPYQQRGYAWLWRNTRLGLGSVIADDMGLGKTLQVLALVQRLKEDGALSKAGALVVVPTSLLTNWHKEAQRFTPGLSVELFHGSKRELAGRRPDILLTTYGVVRSELARLKVLPWRLIVIDEAQNIKNPAAAQTRAVKAIPAETQVAMSGTPVENRLSEYWSIMDFAQRGYLGGLTHFTREFVTPIQTHRDGATAERLRKVMAPFMLRRLKSDKSIIDDLPDKLEQDQFCTLSREQAALYETVVREGMRVIAGESNTFQRQGLVLQMILALKQVCNHPAQYLKQGAAEAAVSGKTQRLLDLLDEIDAAQGRALVFTQFREMGELLVQMLQARQRQAGTAGREPLFLHGGVTRARRDDMVERFQNDPAQRVFVLSLKAGGTGLNLTAANHVIHYDLWWNPAVEAQATDRAYRIGQQRKVQVHRFITRGTFEERINEMIRSKRELAELAVGTGETWIGQLPPQELKALFELA